MNSAFSEQGTGTREEIVTSFKRSLRILESFFAMVDSGEIFHSQDMGSCRNVRKDLRSSLVHLLVWQRPRLEALKGIHWPYLQLRKRYSFFRDSAEESSNNFERKQALLFLALLPFPEQWKWLLKAEQLFCNDPEIEAFLAKERCEVLRKIEKKPQRTYKLRHFCQVLKKPGLNTKGVLRIFSLPYLFVFQTQLLKRLSKRHVLYVEPPMGVVFRHAWWRYFSELEDPCIMGVGSQEDRSFFETQHGVVVVPLAHGDYMDDLEWQASAHGELDKDYDIVFNATFDDMPRKRHNEMLNLLHHPLLRNTRALFLGRGEESHVSEFTRRVNESGLASRVAIKANLLRAEIPAQIASCRMGVHLSLYENACRSIYEFIRSDLPCVIPSSMGGMNPAIFNGDTGMAVLEKDLPKAIAFTLEKRQQFRPRQWFINNSGSDNSSSKLNSLLKGFFTEWGYDWREDIVPLGSSGASRYVQASDYQKFQSEFEWILEAFNTLKHNKLNFSIE